MDSQQDHFIVCGLGSLGQQTIINLRKFSQAPDEISIAAIDLVEPSYWEVETLPNLLSQPVLVGDSRQYGLLKKAGIDRCRSILVVTSDESVNVETALAARRLNPQVHIVLRSSRYNLNQLLKRQLGQFVALDAMALPANTFALAGMGNNILSVFKIGQLPFRVVKRVVERGEPRFDGLPLQRLFRRDSRLLHLSPNRPLPPGAEAQTASRIFHRWQPDVTLQAGDTVTMVEIDYAYDRKDVPSSKNLWTRLQEQAQEFISSGWHRRFLSFWGQGEQQSLRRITAIALFTILISWPVGTLLIKQAIPDLSWARAITLGVILLLGGYGDVFGGLEETNLPIWLPFVCLLIALASLFLVLGVLSLLADQLLSSRFEFLRRRPQLPKRNHVIVVGLGRLGYRAINILKAFNQPLIAITHELAYPELVSEVPLLTGNILQQLTLANLAGAKSVLAVTDDPMLNLEIALIVSEAIAESSPSQNIQANPESLTETQFANSQTSHQTNGQGDFTPIIRTVNRALSDNVAVLLPQAKAYSVYALSAEAFAGAAFGENILSLFRLQNQTILVTEYHIATDDHLNQKLLADVAYGYGVVPILLKTRSAQGGWRELPMPGDDLRLQSGDRLHILSSINGLRRIERGDAISSRTWQLQLGKPLNSQVLLAAGNTLMQLSGQDLALCRSLMENLPATLELALYPYQAYRLQEELQRYIPTQLSAL
ncbi:MAG: NAD-binding protein [Cyanobacteria bacterium J06623_4]